MAKKIKEFKLIMQAAKPQMQPWLRASATNIVEHLCLLNPVNLKSSALFSQFTTREISHPIPLIADSSPKILIKCDETNPEAYFIGLSNTYREITLDSYQDYFFIELYSTFATQGWSHSIQEASNQVSELLEWLPFATELIEHVVIADSFQERIQLTKNYFVENMVDHNYRISLAEYTAVALYGNYRTITMKEMEQIMGYSRRSLEYKFRSSTGVSPKKYTGIFRIQDAVAMLLDEEREYSNARIANEIGYFDEAHFINDFSANMKTSPQEFRKEMQVHDKKLQRLT